MLTELQKNYIKENYNYKKTKNIAEYLNINDRIIQYYAKKMNLIDKKNKYYIKNNIVNFLCVTQKDEQFYFKIDIEDFDKIYNYGKWFIKKGKNKTYVVCNKIINNKKTIIRLHRIILNIKDNNIDVDHIDGNPLNNCKINLRICNDSQNMNNLQKARIDNNSTGFLNISYSKRDNVYKPEVQINKNRIYFKGFKSLDEAKLLINYVRAKYINFSQEYFNRDNIIKNTPKEIANYADKKVLSKVNM